MIHIKNVSKSFNGKKVLEQLSIEIKPGTIYGLIGENGAGKSTLLQCVMGIYTVDEGSICVDGKPVYENNEVKQEMGYVADRNQYFKGATVADMISFFKLTYPSFLEELFDKYNLTFKLDKKEKVKNLSKGMQMKLSLMLNMAIRPKVLVLDEPTSGLDPLAKKQVLDYLIEEVDETKMAVLISSHHLGELERICDEITMISKGKAVYQSTVEDIKNKVRKLQVVFKEEVTWEAKESIKEWEDVLDVTHVGSVYYIVTNAYSQELEERLKRQGAFLIESIGLNLEEVFVYTAQAHSF